MSASTLQTHVSTLFFTDDRVFKLLRPVKTGFLDHSDRDARLKAAENELALNRRLAPDVYLGLAEVREHGEVVDRMIVMRRLPSDRSMTELIRRDELTDEHLRAIARKIAAFHSSLQPILDPEGPGSLAVQASNWGDSFNEVAPFLDSVLDRSTEHRIESLVTRFLNGRQELFARRVADGHVRDGHGDLLADDIFLTDDGPQILDCLAFDARFRIGDVLSDIAFLAMDLHRLAGPAAASALITHYDEFAGEVHPPALAHHYVAYRAFVRCKVACLLVQEGSIEQAAVARMYHRLALDHLERARLRLVIVGGGPGTGKTSIANAIGDSFGWSVLSSDVVRKELALSEALAHEPAEPDTGLYTPEMTQATYAELVRRAEVLLNGGESVVIDASFTRDQHRAEIRLLADECLADLVELECRIAPALARERVARRLADAWDPSDATPEVVDHLREIRDSWPEAHGVETTRPIDTTMASVLALLADDDTPNASPVVDFWGCYSRYKQIASSRPFHTVI